MFCLSELEDTVRVPPLPLKLPLEDAVTLYCGYFYSYTYLWFHLYVAVTLGFFDDVYVPAPLIPTPNRCEPDPYNRNQMRWVWIHKGDKYIIDDSCQIKFRVENISYPPVPTEPAEDAKPFAPMVITGTLDDDGLGPVSWWENCTSYSNSDDDDDSET